MIKRKNVEKPITFNIVRDEVEVKVVTTKPPIETKIPNNIQYIRLNSFLSKNAGSEIGEIILKTRDKDGYILDLRSNPGGIERNLYLCCLLTSSK